MKALTSAGSVELLGEKHRRGLENLVGPAQLAVLTLKRLQPLALVGRQPVVAGAGIDLGLAHPQAQRFLVDTEIARDMRDRALRLEHQPDRALAQLIGVLLGTWHRRDLLLSPEQNLVSRPPSNSEDVVGRAARA
jgi:hypothetical protein